MIRIKAALEENRKVAMAQIMEARAAETGAHYRMLSASELVPVVLKLRESGVDSLSDEERVRMIFLQVGAAARQDALYDAHRLRLMDDDAYETSFIPSIQALAPKWGTLGLPPMRWSFEAEVDRILALDPQPGSSGYRVERHSG